MIHKIHGASKQQLHPFSCQCPAAQLSFSSASALALASASARSFSSKATLHGYMIYLYNCTYNILDISRYVMCLWYFMICDKKNAHTSQIQWLLRFWGVAFAVWSFWIQLGPLLAVAAQVSAHGTDSWCLPGLEWPWQWQEPRLARTTIFLGTFTSLTEHSCCRTRSVSEKAKRRISINGSLWQTMSCEPASSLASCTRGYKNTCTCKWLWGKAQQRESIWTPSDTYRL